MKTYTRLELSPTKLISKAVTLYKHRTRGIPEQAAGTVKTVRDFEDRLREATGSGLRGKKLLIVGTGQTLREFYAFATLGADVTGIDLDVVPIGLDLVGYANLWRKNGFGRFAKTAGRRILGVDRRFERALADALGAKALKRGKLLAMDASQMQFPDNHFDAAYSFSVFEHLPDPAAVGKEIVRVLKPGGLLFVSTHIYSGDGGNHDLRIFAGDRADIPFWAHLRPEHQSKTNEDCYVNRWTLAQWDALYKGVFPGCRVEYEPHHAAFDRELKAELTTLRGRGELEDYTDLDLLTVNAIAHWQKPAISVGDSSKAPAASNGAAA
jgi:SAM-dependent methyltransferase